MFDEPMCMSDTRFDREAATEPAKSAAHQQLRRRRRGFAGFSWGQLVLGGAFLGAAVWGVWLTREVMVLQDRRIVSVSLAAMANDFVMAEAHAGNSPEQTDADTRHYMTALQKVLKDRALRGEVILVGEAVVSGSVPDMTAEIRGAVGKLITASPSPRVASLAAVAPPATSSMAVPAPAVSQGSAVLPVLITAAPPGPAALVPGGREVANAPAGN